MKMPMALQGPFPVAAAVTTMDITLGVRFLCVFSRGLIWIYFRSRFSAWAEATTRPIDWGAAPIEGNRVLWLRCRGTCARKGGTRFRSMKVRNCHRPKWPTLGRWEWSRSSARAAVCDGWDWETTLGKKEEDFFSKAGKLGGNPDSSPGSSLQQPKWSQVVGLKTFTRSVFEKLNFQHWNFIASLMWILVNVFAPLVYHNILNNIPFS